MKVLTTTVHSVNNMGSCKSSCDSEVRKIRGWSVTRNNFMTAAHIPGVMNVEADAESRSSETKTEWKMNESYSNSFLHQFRSNH